MRIVFTLQRNKRLYVELFDNKTVNSSEPQRTRLIIHLTIHMFVSIHMCGVLWFPLVEFFLLLLIAQFVIKVMSALHPYYFSSFFFIHK